MAVFILAIATAAGATYGRGQSRKRQHTEVALELTERLLGDVHYEKDLVTEEKERMEQAWVIEETDLAYGEVLGEGAFGRVYRGTWGYAVSCTRGSFTITHGLVVLLGTSRSRLKCYIIPLTILIRRLSKILIERSNS